MLVMYLVVKDCRCLLTVVNLSTTTWKHRPAISDSKSLVPIWPQRVTDGHTSTKTHHSKAIYVHVRGLDVVKMPTIVRVLRPSNTLSTTSQESLRSFTIHFLSFWGIRFRREGSFCKFQQPLVPPPPGALQTLSVTRVLYLQYNASLTRV